MMEDGELENLRKALKACSLSVSSTRFVVLCSDDECYQFRAEDVLTLVNEVQDLRGYARKVRAEINNVVKKLESL